MPAICLSIILLAGIIQRHVYAAPAQIDILTRSTTCSGDASLSPCGGSFPADFCCPHSSICLPLNATAAVAAVCCPPGVNCLTIQPTTCEQGAYNATTAAANQVHVSPITALATCGSACCPAGYTCQNGNLCTAISNSTTTVLPTQSLASTSTPTTVNSSSAEIIASTDSPASASSFSGGSFAAGFIPGIVLGMLLIAIAIWLLRRRRRANLSNEKARSQDQLTGLTPSLGPARPVPHMRSISGPAVLGETHRSDFLRSSPSVHTTDHTSSIETIDEERSSASDQYNDRRPMFAFEASTVPSRSPLPMHMKRGTLSYTISPIRQLRTKKSVSSLRRHATDASQRARLSIARSNTSASTVTTGTIQVAMTPDQHPTYVPPTVQHDTVSPLASSTYPPEPWATPTRQPMQPQPGVLGSPYSYRPRDHVNSDYLDPNAHTRNKRVTTFSSLMERAGLRKEDLLPKER